jgi:hypothetical protein
MTIKKISILLTFFIFVTVSGTGADNVKSMKNTANQEPIMKIDENKGAVQKRKEPARAPGTPLKKLKPRLPGADFLKALEEAKKFPLRDSLHKVIYSYEFFQDIWKDRFLSSREINRTKSSNSDFGQSIPNLYPDGDNYFREGKILPTFRLLQSKKEEPFREIFMGFRLSFDPKSARMLVEMNISPSYEKGPGVIIPF